MLGGRKRNRLAAPDGKNLMGIMMLPKNEKPDRGLAKPLRRARPYQILFTLVLLDLEE